MKEFILEGIKQIIKEDVDEMATRNLMILSVSFGENILYEAGKRYGKIFAFKHKIKNLWDLRERLKEYFKSDVIMFPENRKLVIMLKNTFSSGNLKVGFKVCYFEAGFLAGIFSYLLKRNVSCIERKCRAEGHEYCEFEVIL